MDKEAVIKEVKRIVRRRLPSEYRIVLFGSWARGNAQETSDIDIGIVGEKKVPWPLMAEILEEARDIQTLRSVDVVDLKAKSKEFQEKILQYARPI